MKGRSGQTMKNTVKMSFGIPMGLVILCLGLTVLADKFATVTNPFNVMRQITISLYLAYDTTFAIFLGSIGLSVGPVVAVTGCVSTGMTTWVGLLVPVGILTGILYGILIGALNGIIISGTTVPAFIATLATVNTGKGIVRTYTHAQTIVVLDDPYTFWGMGSIPGSPIQLYLIIAVMALAPFILNKTGLSRRIYATGGNKIASEYSGVDVKRVAFFVFVLNGSLASLAGVLTAGRAFTTAMIMGDGIEMNTTVAVVLGGTSMSGGKGNISGTVIGIIVIGILKNSMNLLRADSSWQYVVQRIITLIAVCVDYIRLEGFAPPTFKVMVGKRA